MQYYEDRSFTGNLAHSNSDPLSHWAIPSLVTASEGLERRSPKVFIFCSFFKKSSG